MTIAKWEDRLNAMDTSKGVSNKMIQEAMRAEIRELRAAVAKSDRKLKKARAKTMEWMNHTRRYQGELARLRSA